jgi:hypothetical protein
VTEPPHPASDYWSDPPSAPAAKSSAPAAKSSAPAAEPTAAGLAEPTAAGRAKRQRAGLRQRRWLILVGASALLVVAIAVIGFEAVHSSARHDAIPTAPALVTLTPHRPSSPTAGTTSPGTTVPATGGLTDTAAQGAVRDYIAAVNARDRSAAAALICASDRSDWQRNADSPDGDFSFTVVDAQLLTTTAQPNAVLVAERLRFDDGSSDVVDFTVVDESGAKLCGIEQR